MEITINSQKRTVDAGTTLSALIDEMGLDDKRIAIEYNREILAREQFATITLHAGDTIEIVNFVGGG
ncbi:MAG: sulfur carrier protein ThiS [Deltaproteobacteria bacterium]|jgi:thiamine biosynthesis protein ThiS|nr:sulfur carrier protein ThiS [Deltaproteobacteria bacterium]